MTASAGWRGGPMSVLMLLGTVSCLLYSGIAWLSGHFAAAEAGSPRPILPFLGLMAAAFGCYLAAVRIAAAMDRQRGLSVSILGFALAFRLILLWSTPILELDIYRYLWDGLVVAEDVNPYRYSPLQVRHAQPGADLSDDLARLVRLRETSPTAAAILARLHFSELTTLYPPVSQAVFAAAARSVPQAASVGTRLVVMKAWLLAFDLATVAILMCILVRSGKSAGWSIAYAWCPLVLKEIANSGHLDSIAVCLMAAAVWLALESLFPNQSGASAEQTPRRPHTALLTATGIALGLAAGAKIFPAVIAPLIFVSATRHRGWREGCLFAAVFAAVSLGTLCPMWLAARSRASSPADAEIAGPLPSSGEALPTGDAARPPHLPPPPPGAVDPWTPQQPTGGLSAFMNRWEMNDFLFMLLIENLRSARPQASAPQPWFVVTPSAWRETLTEDLAPRLRLESGAVAFLVSRLIALSVFALAAVFWMVRASRARCGSEWGEAVFLTLAWFWLLLPTQNPWYWVWAVPFLPFARSRAWLAMSGLTLIYYARFWFADQWPDSPVPPTGYLGTQFFDYIVVWIEFAPWFVWLSIDALRRRRAAG